MSGPGIRTVCSVIAAGITIIANIATTIPAQTAGLGNPCDRGEGIVNLRSWWPRRAHFLSDKSTPEPKSHKIATKAFIKSLLSVLTKGHDREGASNQLPERQNTDNLE
jgi:hypothetical protein